MSKKPWKGRFQDETADLMERFSESVSFDQRLYRHDIEGSMAHARMLGERGIIPEEDARKIVEGLVKIRGQIDSGTFQWDSSLEDVHMNIESSLGDLVGDAGLKLHTARSRNDQVALDFRMFIREESGKMGDLLAGLLEALLSAAEGNFGTVMPGYTHMQRAQPVLLSHHLMAYFEMFRRDHERFTRMADSLNVSPLGAGALAGTTFPIDREKTARDLGFSRISRNSMDAVSDRDFAAEFLFTAALCQVHLSRLAEEIVLWSTQEFSFVILPDSYCTGSSMMPQKKNPDPAELVRGKTGRAIGNLTSLLVILKGLPMTYNRDLQEDKEPVFDSADTLSASLEVMTGLISNTRFDQKRLQNATVDGFTTATDLADYLVTRGIPFRKAHEIAGQMVGACLDRGCALTDLTLDEMRHHSEHIDRDVYDALSVQSSVKRRDVPGGTAPGRVKKAMEEARVFLDQNTVDN
ncbi:MAG: argininosuccinate lyase [Deltaproteobacteria bacterium]|nr:argininosuccinate lyase [Deltaproteobacteria bacterium]